MRQATLIVVGGMTDALPEAARRTIKTAKGVTEFDGPKGRLTKLVVDADRYSHVIADWLNESRQNTPGTLLRVSRIAS